MKRPVNPYKKLYFALLIPLAVTLKYIASLYPGLTEKYYSMGVYKFIGQPLSTLTGLLPFSLAEIIVLSLVVYGVYRIVILIIKLFQKKHGKYMAAVTFLTDAIMIASIIYFLFAALWGMNYHRLSYGQIAGLDTRPASVKELEELCGNLMDRANRLRSLVHENEKGVMYLPSGPNDALKRAYKGYIEAAKIRPELKGTFGRPKGVMLSELMSYAGITGVYFPLTGEANVDIKTPDLFIPSTITHEMAHQRGFAREDEANYISYLACSMDPDVDFQYSGVMLALVSSMDALYGHDQEAYMNLAKKYSNGIRRDLIDNNEYWKKHEGTVEKISNEINNAYLKSNMQKDGVYSYGRMVDLLIAEYRMKPNK